MPNRGGPVDIGGNEERCAPFLAEFECQFRRDCRFACTLQSNEHHDCRPARCNANLLRLGTHQVGKFFPDDAGDLELRREAAHDFLAEGTRLNPLYKLARDFIVDICLQKRAPHLAQGVGDIALSQFPLPAQFFEGALQSIA